MAVRVNFLIVYGVARMKRKHWGRLLVLSIVVNAIFASAQPSAQTPVRIMCMGDSITEGGASFSNWRYPLWTKLHAGGCAFVFVGSKQSESPAGALPHEGYGGKTVEYLATFAADRFASCRPDILLLHAGHNHTVEQNPIPAILAATEKIIVDFRHVNPQGTILLAQVIPSLKLPKYRYIPALNQELAKLGKRLDLPTSRIVVVDCAAGFDPQVDCVADRVHPSATGAEKMASAWAAALQPFLAKKTP